MVKNRKFPYGLSYLTLGIFFSGIVHLSGFISMIEVKPKIIPDIQPIQTSIEIYAAPFLQKPELPKPDQRESPPKKTQKQETQIQDVKAHKTQASRKTPHINLNKSTSQQNPLPSSLNKQSEDSPIEQKITAITKPKTADYLNNPPPPYPKRARRQGQEGTVILDAVIAQDGTVKGLTIMQSSGYFLLDQAAFNTVQSWQFIPAKRGNITIEANVEIPIIFQIKD